jgi:hypothetical protein
MASTRVCSKCGATTANNKYCSRSCAVSANNAISPKRKTAKVYRCETCNVEVLKQRKYCSRACRTAPARAAVVELWLSGSNSSVGYRKMPRAVRIWLLDRAGNKCEECGWDTPHPVLGYPWLTVDHVDGDPQNNQPENLKVLCLRCHGQTETFSGLNFPGSRARRGLPDLGYQSMRPLERDRRRRDKERRTTNPT